MMDDVGFDFDDMGIRLKPKARKFRLWLVVCLAVVAASMLFIKPLFGVGIVTGIMVGAIGCMAWLVRGGFE